MKPKVWWPGVVLCVVWTGLLFWFSPGCSRLRAADPPTVKVLDAAGNVKRVPLDEYVDSLVGPKELTYVQAYAKAYIGRLPLVAFVGPNTPARSITGAVSYRAKGEDGLGDYDNIRVIVPDYKGSAYCKILSNKAADGDILHAAHEIDKYLNPPPVQRSAAPNVGSCRCGQGGCFCYPASKCSQGLCPQPAQKVGFAPTFTLPTLAVCKT